MSAEQSQASTPDVPAAPQKPTVSPEELEARLASFDPFLLALALLLAFALALSPILNTDLWVSLASGRDLLNGSYNPFAAQDPYSFTGSEWINHSWLYGAALYGLHQMFGMSGLVVAKALLVTLLAWVLFRVGRCGRGFWVPAIAAALAMVVVKSRLLLQPVVISYLFLGLTLFFLQRGSGRLYGQDPASRDRPRSWKDYWPILVLFLFWVNLNEWFVLGPVTVGLYALGQAIQSRINREDVRPGELQALGILLVGAVLVCLINPYHVRAFTLPVELGLSAPAAALRKDPVLRGLFRSAFDPVLFRAANISAAHVAYFVVAGLTLLSFAVNFRGFRVWRALLVLFFFVLASVHVRATPYFGIVAAPLLSLNFQETVQRRRRTHPLRSRDVMPRLGRAVAFVVLLTLLAAAWPGWLGSRPHANARVSVRNDLDPALEGTAQYLRQMYAQASGRSEPRGYHFTPEIAHALAWFAPEVKGFFDTRYRVFAGQPATDFVEVRLGLMAGPAERSKQPDWRAILSQHRIDHVVIYGTDRERLTPVLGALALDPLGRFPKHWALLHLEGGAAVYGWLQARPEFGRLRLNVDQLAYAPPDHEQAPPEGPDRLPTPRPFWEAYTVRPPTRTVDADQAAMHLLQFLCVSERFQNQKSQLWAGTIAGQVVAGVAAGGPLSPLALAPLAIEIALSEMERRKRNEKPGELDQIAQNLERRFSLSRDDGPAEHLWLAIRAARRALAHDPNDAVALEQLGLAYLQLQTSTRERLWADAIELLERRIGRDPRAAPQALPVLFRVRHAQVVFALRSLLDLRPDLASAHTFMINLLDRLGRATGADGEPRGGYWDLILEHASAELRLTRQRGRFPSETEEQARNRLDSLAQRVQKMKEQVEARQNRFKNMKERLKTPTEEARAAFNLNLAGEALRILLAADLDSLDEEGRQLRFEIALNSGRVGQALAMLAGSPGEKLAQEHPFQYYWFRLRLNATLGNYELADQDLLKLAELCRVSPLLPEIVRGAHINLGIGKEAPSLMTTEQAAAFIVGKAVLDATLPAYTNFLVRLQEGLAGRVISTLWIERSVRERVELLRNATLNTLGPRIEEANLHFVRGLLALEAGYTDRAVSAFKTVQETLAPLEPFRGASRHFADEAAQEFLRKMEVAK